MTISPTGTAALLPGVSAVIPVFNGEASLEPLCARLAQVLAAGKVDFEIVFVEDCSRDNSWKTIEALARRDSRFRGIRLSRNFGQHNALLCGIRQARYDITVTLDDDLQNPPEEIPRLLEKLGEEYDVVYGAPEAERHGLWRNLASRITKRLLQNAMGAETAGRVSAFRVFRTELRESFSHYVGAFVSIDVLLTWGTTRFSALRVRHDGRAAGTSNYTLRKLLSHAMNMMTGFSVLPLKLASVSGFFFAFFGLGVFVYVVTRKLAFGTPVPGFPFLASTIAIFSGAQLLSLGIIGEYLARMHFRIMEKPVYAVRSATFPDPRPRA